MWGYPTTPIVTYREDFNVSELKQKLTLQNKGQQVAIAVEKLQVVLQWRAAVDLDLMAFYKAKDGRIGGIFSDNYPGGTLGSLSQFPFIQLSADAGVDAKSGDHHELLVIERLDEMAEVYVCTLNYTDAAARRDSAFANYDGAVVVSDSTGHTVEIPLNAKEKGQVAVIAHIECGTGVASLKNANTIMSLGQFFQNIPGASHLSSDSGSTNSQATTTATNTSSQTTSRWAEGVKLRAYDNPYLDKAIEKELLSEAISQGMTFEDARSRLLQICSTEHYALASYLEEQAARVLEQCLASKQKIQQGCCKDAIDLVQQASYGHLKMPDCRKLVKNLIVARQWPVKQGIFSGGSWFDDL